MTKLSCIQTYFEVTKPKIWYLLVFTAFGAMIVAGRGWVPLERAALMITAVTLGAAGANTLTNYIDRDVDAVMNRTRLRPLPSGRITPPSKALIFGLILVLLSLVTSYALGLMVLIFMLLGILDNVVVYSRIFKRRNPANIILGGFSGGMPVLIGYTAVAGHVDLVSIVMAGLVVLWIPTHIWSLAIKYRSDYVKAKIPMLPAVTEEKTAVRCISLTSILMVIFSLIPFILGVFHTIYLYAASGLGVVMLILNFWLIVKPTEYRAWIVFKFSSPYLALIFTAMMLDVSIKI